MLPKPMFLIEDLPADIVMADTAYDSDRLREAIARKGAKAVIPSPQIPARPSPLCLVHLIECCFSKRKQFRRVTMRFGKTARNYPTVVTVAATILWIR